MISSNPRRSGFPIEAFGNDGRGQLGQIASDDDATCDAPNRGVYPYVEVMEHRMLLSQRREMPQLPQLGFRASDNDATRNGAFRRRISIRRRKAPQVLLS